MCRLGPSPTRGRDAITSCGTGPRARFAPPRRTPSAAVPSPNHIAAQLASRRQSLQRPHRQCAQLGSLRIGQPTRPKARLPRGRSCVCPGAHQSGHVISLVCDLNFRGMPCNIPHLPEATEQALHGHPWPKQSKFLSGEQGVRGPERLLEPGGAPPAIVGSSTARLRQHAGQLLRPHDATSRVPAQPAKAAPKRQRFKSSRPTSPVRPTSKTLVPLGTGVFRFPGGVTLG